MQFVEVDFTSLTVVVVAVAVIMISAVIIVGVQICGGVTTFCNVELRPFTSLKSSIQMGPVGKLMTEIGPRVGHTSI